MAKVMSYTHPATGAEYPESVWAPLGIYIDHTTKQARVVFLGYANVAALAAGKAPVGEHSYAVSGDDYLKMAGSKIPEGTMLTAVAIAAYGLAETMPDTSDQNDPKKMVSFFADAKDIALPG